MISRTWSREREQHTRNHAGGNSGKGARGPARGGGLPTFCTHSLGITPKKFTNSKLGDPKKDPTGDPNCGTQFFGVTGGNWAGLMGGF